MILFRNSNVKARSLNRPEVWAIHLTSLLKRPPPHSPSRHAPEHERSLAAFCASLSILKKATAQGRHDRQHKAIFSLMMPAPLQTLNRASQPCRHSPSRYPSPSKLPACAPLGFIATPTGKVHVRLTISSRWSPSRALLKVATDRAVGARDDECGAAASTTISERFDGDIRSSQPSPQQPKPPAKVPHHCASRRRRIRRRGHSSRRDVPTAAALDEKLCRPSSQTPLGRAVKSPW